MTGVPGDSRPRPRYGEYAPIDHSAPADRTAPGRPLAGDSATGRTLAGDTAAGSARTPTEPGRTPTPPVQSSGPDLAKPAPTTRRNWDVTLTTALLLFGVLDVVGSFAAYGNLAATLRQVWDQQGIGSFTRVDLATDMGVALNVTRVILLVVAIAFSLWRIGHRRIAFWVPLTAGVIAILVVAVSLGVLVLGDPSFTEYVTQQTSAS